jgi:hypothetical protein
MLTLIGTVFIVFVALWFFVVATILLVDLFRGLFLYRGKD